MRMWDESRNAVNAIEMYQNGDYIVRSYKNQPETWNLKPPLLTWLQVAAMHVAGVTDLAIRLPSILASFGSLLLLFLLVYRITSSHVFGFLGAGMLATSAGFYGDHVGRFGDHDALLVFFGLALAYSCYLYHVTQKNTYLYWAAMAICLGILTKSIAILIMLPGMALFFVVRQKTLIVLTNKHLYFAIFLMLIPIVSYYASREHLQPGFLSLVWNDELFPRYFNSSANFEYRNESFWYYFDTLWRFHMSYWLWFLPIVLIVVLTKSRNDGLLFLIITSVTYLLIISKGTKNFWYDASVIPLLSALLAVSFHAVYQRFFQSKLFAIALVLGLLYAPFIQAFHYALYPTEKYYEWETNGISHFLRNETHLKNVTSNTKILLDTSYGYEPHMFYVKKLRLENNLTLERAILQHVSQGDTLLLSHQSCYDALNQKWKITVLDSSFSHTKLVAVGELLL
jgi:4-amino-4-deoxy-L-arabinose transferase-like glycosyltransferase